MFFRFFLWAQVRERDYEYGAEMSDMSRFRDTFLCNFLVLLSVLIGTIEEHHIIDIPHDPQEVFFSVIVTVLFKY